MFEGTFGMSVQLSSAFMKHAFTEAMGTFVLLSNPIQNECTVSFLTETSDWFPSFYMSKEGTEGGWRSFAAPRQMDQQLSRTGFGAGGNTAHKILEKL